MSFYSWLCLVRTLQNGPTSRCVTARPQNKWGSHSIAHTLCSMKDTFWLLNHLTTITSMATTTKTFIEVCICLIPLPTKQTKRAFRKGKGKHFKTLQAKPNSGVCSPCLCLLSLQKKLKYCFPTIQIYCTCVIKSNNKGLLSQVPFGGQPSS